MTEPYPQDHDFTAEDDELEQLDAPLTPEEDFDAFFEAWQDAAADAHMRQALAALDVQGRRLVREARPGLAPDA